MPNGKVTLEAPAKINLTLDVLGKREDGYHDLRMVMQSVELCDFFEYERNKLLRRAVERELEIIGEAVKHLLELDENICIDNARRIVDLRNFVIHGYDKVDNVIIWGILSKDLPKLKQQVDALMAEQTLL